ncbi:winged helix-turn-helix domain-containing protein [Erwinia sp. SLM-02]|uniref:winged helix-turn-helix domain-containing protein n=1 Tax=Erwinia sp. SLM-02 TaxID=3020057 RepID=UPI003080E1DA
MMKQYRIDNQLLYNPDDRSLVRIDDDLSRGVLTPISNRLFCLFLESDGSVMPRDTLLQKVWDDHNLIASGSNLNNYISSLRKQLAALGLEVPLIITEPKMGFRIDADRVKVQIDADEVLMPGALSEAPHPGEQPELSEKTISAQSAGEGPFNASRIWLWVFAAAVVLTLLAGGMMLIPVILRLPPLK